ncbi:hypothetical protein AB205_0197140, partial [Aquarana catesbeiana]
MRFVVRFVAILITTLCHLDVLRFSHSDVIPYPAYLFPLPLSLSRVVCLLANMLAMQYVGSAVILAAIAAFIDKEEEDNRRRRRHRFWIHPIIAQREVRGQFGVLYNDLRAHEDKFFNYTRMSIRSFDELLALLSSHLERQNTSFRRSIPAVERLIITL